MAYYEVVAAPHVTSTLAAATNEAIDTIIFVHGNPTYASYIQQAEHPNPKTVVKNCCSSTGTSPLTHPTESGWRGSF